MRRQRSARDAGVAEFGVDTEQQLRQPRLDDLRTDLRPDRTRFGERLRDGRPQLEDDPVEIGGSGGAEESAFDAECGSFGRQRELKLVVVPPAVLDPVDRLPLVFRVLGAPQVAAGGPADGPALRIEERDQDAGAAAFAAEDLVTQPVGQPVAAARLGRIGRNRLRIVVFGFTQRRGD